MFDDNSVPNIDLSSRRTALQSLGAAAAALLSTGTDDGADPGTDDADGGGRIDGTAVNAAPAGEEATLHAELEVTE